MNNLKSYIKHLPILAYSLIFLVFFVKLCLGMLLWQEAILGVFLALIALYQHKIERHKEFLALEEEYKKLTEEVKACKNECIRLNDSINSLKLRGIRG